MMATQTEVRTTAKPPAGAIVARLAKVTKNYGPITALREVDFAVHAGEVVALLGPNGAGKTTVVRSLLGLCRPASGNISVFGGDPNQAAIRMRIGAMLQVARVPETLKVWEHIDLFSSYYLHPLPLAETLAAAGLTALKNRKFGDLSGGQKQRVLFALAICGNPDLLFLDEPTAGLDVEARRSVWTEIRKLVQQGKTVLLTTHYLEEADALADRIVVINRGSVIAEGTSAEIKARTSGKRVRCVTQLTAEEVLALPGVTSAKQDREALDLHTLRPEAVIRELLARDPQLSGLEVTSAGLEDAFLALTREDNAQNSTMEVIR